MAQLDSNVGIDIEEYIPSYHAIIERLDGSTFSQKFRDFYDLLDLVKSLGSDYLVVEIY